MSTPSAFSVAAIVGFRLAAPDPGAALAFLREALEARPVDETTVRLGDIPLQVCRGAPLPILGADDPGFQHLAIVVADIATAFERVTARGATPISRAGPVRLPPSSGGVTAWKFRSPWNQPLELLQSPTEAWRTRAQKSGALFLGVDHTALGCRDADAALRAFEDLGFSQGDTSHNIGPEQDALDGLGKADVRIRTLFTPDPGPHIELLDYASHPPGDGRPAGATVMVAGRHREDRDARLVEAHPLVMDPSFPA